MAGDTDSGAAATGANLRHLRVFLSVVAQGSATRAAADCRLLVFLCV